MNSFSGKLAVITGGGGGIGRELVAQLAAEGCSVAVCDMAPEALAQTLTLATAAATQGARITTHVCDITDEAAVIRMRDEVCAQHETQSINLLFNNAGIFGAGSFLTDDRAAWERVFNVCWFGVYNVCRAFVPLVVASDEGHVINTSSANALRAVHGPGAPSTSYSAGKWAVRGFTEALIEDFRTHAPHVRVSLVMPGGVGTDIRANSQRILTRTNANGSVTSGSEHLRAYLSGMGVPLEDVSAATLDHLMDVMQSDVFAMPPGQAAADLLTGVREGRWRIFIGVGARELDEAVRANPEIVYDTDGPSLLNRDLLISMMVLSSRFTPAGGTADGTYELRLDSSPIICQVSDGRLSLSRQSVSPSDVIVEADPAAFRRLILKQAGTDDLTRQGVLKVTGDGSRLAKLLEGLAS